MKMRYLQDLILRELRDNYVVIEMEVQVNE